VRDAHIGVLWEGTSNINALDIITRAVGRSGAHRALGATFGKLLDEAGRIPASFRDRLRHAGPHPRLRRAHCGRAGVEANARRAASSLYHITSAVLMAWEASHTNVDARRALLARLVLEHRLSVQDPLAPAAFDWEGDAAELIFASRALPLADISAFLTR
jgi:hypothetical protein